MFNISAKLKRVVGGIGIIVFVGWLFYNDYRYGQWTEPHFNQVSQVSIARSAQTQK